MKAKVLKEIGKKGIIGGSYFAKDSIIDVDVPDGGKIVYTNNLSTGRKDYPLTIGTDVELILDKEVKSIDGFAPKTTKVKVLKQFFTGGVTGGIVNVGDIIMVGTPVNGKVYVNNIQTMKPIELIIGKDVELVKEEMTKEQKGGLLFYGALAVLGYIVYRVLTTK